MRPIKFRVFNTAAKLMYPVAHFGLKCDGTKLQWMDGSDENPNFRFTYAFLIYMQFTGLHDKNGKEIYEGDILQSETGLKYMADWHDEGSGYLLVNPRNPTSIISWFNANSCGAMEIIGNKYENPELTEPLLVMPKKKK